MYTVCAFSYLCVFLIQGEQIIFVLVAVFALLLSFPCIDFSSTIHLHVVLQVMDTKHNF